MAFDDPQTDPTILFRTVAQGLPTLPDSSLETGTIVKFKDGAGFAFLVQNGGIQSWSQGGNAGAGLFQVFLSPTGNDANNGASVATPVLTPERAIAIAQASGQVPQFCFAAGTYTWSEFVILSLMTAPDQTGVAGSSFAFQRGLLGAYLTGGFSGAPIASGAVTSTTNTAKLTTNQTPLLDAWVRCFVKMTSGASVNLWAPVSRNTTSGDVYLGRALNVTNGDTFEIRQPDVHIIHQGVGFQYTPKLNIEGIWFDGPNGVSISNETLANISLSIFDGGLTGSSGLSVSNGCELFNTALLSPYALSRGMGPASFFGQQSCIVTGRFALASNAYVSVSGMACRNNTQVAVLIRDAAFLSAQDLATYGAAGLNLQLQGGSAVLAASSAGVEWYNAANDLIALNGFNVSLNISGYVLNSIGCLAELNGSNPLVVGVMTGTLGTNLLQLSAGAIARVVPTMNMATTGANFNMNGANHTYADVDAGTGGAKWLFANGATIYRN